MSNSTHLLNVAKLNARIDEAENMTSKAEKLLPNATMREVDGGPPYLIGEMKTALQGLATALRESRCEYCGYSISCPRGDCVVCADRVTALEKAKPFLERSIYGKD